MSVVFYLAILANLHLIIHNNYILVLATGIADKAGSNKREKAVEFAIDDSNRSYRREKDTDTAKLIRRKKDVELAAGPTAGEIPPSLSEAILNRDKVNSTSVLKKEKYIEIRQRALKTDKKNWQLSFTNGPCRNCKTGKAQHVFEVVAQFKPHQTQHRKFIWEGKDIQCVKVEHKGSPDTRGQVTYLGGGYGFPFISLEMRSKQNRGFHYQVFIYTDPC